MSDFLDAVHDKWSFHRDDAGLWRWARVDRDGETVGMAHRGFQELGDCESNARRAGWNGIAGKAGKGTETS